MKQFDIFLETFEDVQEFVALATVQPFRILVGNDRTRVNAKSFMGIFSLDLTTPVQVRADCNEEEYVGFKLAASRFLTN
jgi:catabolite repression HPr-like protein